MSTITFEPTNFDGNVGTSDVLKSLIYLSLVADSGGSYGGSVAGWVRPEVAKLVKAAPDLLQALTDLGDWLAYGMNKAAGAEPTAEDHATCERIAKQARAAIDKATGAA